MAIEAAAVTGGRGGGERVVAALMASSRRAQVEMEASGRAGRGSDRRHALQWGEEAGGGRRIT
jgi:hypothetical protein